ncbi:MAG: hypothetical protein M1482_12415 [Chloroflexi bacterium]|nr:hypothetical protein [Chloroflexota bacterium]
MSEVVGVRSLIYWWGALTATIFVNDWLKQIAGFFQDPKSFSSDKFPFNVLPGLNSSIDSAANYLRDQIKLDPQQVIAGSGSLAFYGWMFAVAVGLIFLGIGVALYVRALNTTAWADDFAALAGIYVILRIEGHIAAVAALPIQGWFRDLVDSPGSAFIILMILLAALVFMGEGFRSKRAFWRGLLEGSLIALFMFPHETASAIGFVIQSLAQFGASLTVPENAPFAIIWGLLGMFLALRRLTTQEAVSQAGH